ncbi:MAG: hypothetical protein ACMUJM_07755 [bacterium]
MKLINRLKIAIILCIAILFSLQFPSSAQLLPPPPDPILSVAFTPRLPVITLNPFYPLLRQAQALTTIVSAPVLTSAGLTVTSLLATPPPTLLNTVTVANSNLATSNWIGTWSSLARVSGGEISLILTQDVISGVVTGTALFANHPLVISGFPVSGIINPVGVASTFQLTGTYINPFSQRLFTITLNCNVISSTLMDGTYSIYNPFQSDYGTMVLIRP